MQERRADEPAENIDASRELAREDDTIDVHEDDRPLPDDDAREDDEAAGDADR